MFLSLSLIKVSDETSNKWLIQNKLDIKTKTTAPDKQVFASP